jgi:hypothetical protein
MSEDFIERFNQWRDGSKHALGRHWWGLLVLLLIGLIEHRIYESTNHFIDSHAHLANLKPLMRILAFGASVTPITLAVALFLLGLFVMLAHAYWETRPTIKPWSLAKRTRSTIKKLSDFIDQNEGNVTAIHFLYDVKFRTLVDRLFSELAAEEVCDILEGDWVINPQIQTVKNIRENVIVQLAKSADRLEAKQSAPHSRLIGELETGKFTVSGSSVTNGVQTYHTNLCVKLRVTNKEPREITLKRANLRLTLDGKTYRGVKASLWNPNSGKDFMEGITDKTPIRPAIATTGLLEFTIDGLQRPDRGSAADTSVILIDEFEVPHTIRNRQLWIAA